MCNCAKVGWSRAVSLEYEHTQLSRNGITGVGEGGGLSENADSDSVEPGWGPRRCISNMLCVDTMLVHGLHFKEKGSCSTNAKVDNNNS